MNDPFEPVAMDFLEEHGASGELLAIDGQLRPRFRLINHEGGGLVTHLPDDDWQRGRILNALRIFIIWAMPRAVIISTDFPAESRFETWALSRGEALGLVAHYTRAVPFDIVKTEQFRSADCAPLLVQRFVPLMKLGKARDLPGPWISHALRILGADGEWPTIRYGGFRDGFDLATA